MSEVAGFEYDIFISYCHDDDHPLAGSRGWVEQFHETLESWLKYRRGLKQLSIWRDRELKGNTLFDSAIEAKIDTTALFFVLHSRNYANSDYCRKELAWFFQHNRNRPGGLHIGEHSRIFHILLNNFPHTQWPPQLAGTAGFPMHDAENDQSLGDFIAPGSSRFETQLRCIVDAAQASLSVMTKNSPASGADLMEPDNSVRIYLADTADGQTNFRNRLTADLKERGIKILAGIPPPYESRAHQQQVHQALQQAQFSIHLLHESPGRAIQGLESSSYPCEQVKMGFSGNARQIIWVPQDLDMASVEDSNHQNWLTQLESGERLGKDYQFVRSSERALTDLIWQEIKKLQQSTLPESISESFLIDTHQLDQQYAYQLAGMMAAKGIDVEFNKESSDPVKSLNFFEQSVRQVPNLIIIFGHVSPKWLAERIKRAVKIAAVQFEREASLQIEKIWIFLTPDSAGPNALPSLPRLIPVSLLDNSNAAAIDPEIIGQLVARDKP